MTLHFFCIDSIRFPYPGKIFPHNGGIYSTNALTRDCYRLGRQVDLPRGGPGTINCGDEFRLCALGRGYDYSIVVHSGKTMDLHKFVPCNKLLSKYVNTETSIAVRTKLTPIIITVTESHSHPIFTNYLAKTKDT